MVKAALNHAKSRQAVPGLGVHVIKVPGGAVLRGSKKTCKTCKKKKTAQANGAPPAAG
ncbi:hypothetical protein HaLaN_01263 [Haematococcus lacustris]|uniref:Uncharacterized protein n=1 Tax=Haematococcus lacustris TaxID=44745 RepID=A0A699YIA1_HAELA|nr:hypothetical protein HaLaN_01263 [Haematococcus lacustris]